MSERAKIVPLETFERAVASMKAFGYVDRGWIYTAYGAFLDRQEKKKDKSETKSGFWKKLGNVLASFVPGLVPADRPPSQRILLGRDPGSLKLLKAVLAHVPETAGKRHHGPRHSSPRRLDELVANADKDDLKLVAKFLRSSGLEETGFPVRLIGEEGEAPKGAGRPGVIARPDRGAALSALTGGLLYRFAYDYDKKLNWEDTQKIFRAGGVYRLYVIPPEQAYVEQRLLLIRLEEDGAIVRAAEIRQGRGGFSVRGGYVIPASGVNTLILSSDFSTGAIASMIEAELSPADREAIFPEGAPPVPPGSSFLQEHQLGFYTLLNRGGGELRGSVLDGPAPAAAVGYKVDKSELGPVSEARLGFLTMDEIERPRDRIMIAAVSSNPSVSIELG